MLQHFLLLTLLTCTANCLDIQITNKWSGAFYGYLNLDPDHILHGWKLKIKFSSPVQRLEMWVANTVPLNDDKTEYLVTNKFYNKNIFTHQSYIIAFIGHVRPTDLTPSVSVEELLLDGPLKATTDMRTMKPTTRILTTQPTTRVVTSQPSTTPLVTTELTTRWFKIEGK